MKKSRMGLLFIVIQFLIRRARMLEKEGKVKAHPGLFFFFVGLKVPHIRKTKSLANTYIYY